MNKYSSRESGGRQATPLILLISTLVLLFSSASIAEEESPRLIIDPRGPSGVVKELLFAPDGNTLISLGGDKAIRFWDVESGALYDTLRLMQGDGLEGILETAAISSDGKFIAVVPRPPEFGDTQRRILLIDLRTRHIAAVLSGHPFEINALEFSDDGRWLASGGGEKEGGTIEGMGGFYYGLSEEPYTGTGLRVWDIRSVTHENSHRPSAGESQKAIAITESQMLGGHYGPVHALKFALGGNRLLSGGYGKNMILWERDENDPGANFVSVHDFSFTPPPSAPVVTADFSPDGKLVAVGSRSFISLWNAETGENIPKPFYEVRGIKHLIFSTDGSEILVSPGAEGTLYRCRLKEEEVKATYGQGAFFVECTKLQGRAMAYFSGGAIKIVNTDTWEPLQILQGDGKSVGDVSFRGNSCSKIIFGYESSKGKFDEHTFDFSTLNLSTEVRDDEAAPLDDTGDEKTADVAKRESDKRRYTAIEFDDSDYLGSADNRKLCHTFTPRGDVAVGAKFTLKLHSSNGKTKHDFIGHESWIRSVACSEDGNFLVSASDDQTIRLWNLRTGALLASLFFSRDEQWVCWTPSGYYAASPDGGKYIGWHFNRGFDKVAGYLSGEQLAYHFHRPDIVQRVVFENRPSSEIIAEMGLSFDLDAALATAPTIEILSHELNTQVTLDRQTIEVAATENGGAGVEQPRLYHQGKSIHPAGPPLYRGGKMISKFNIMLMPGENRLQAITRNENRIVSKPAEVTLRFEGNAPQGDLHLFFVGVDDYAEDSLDLHYAKKDALAIHDILQKGASSFYKKVHTHFLGDGEATKEAVLAKFAELAEIIRPEDVFVFGFNGHGQLIAGDNPNDSRFYLLLGELASLDGRELALHAIEYTEIYQAFESIPALKQLAFFGACQSGGIIDGFARSRQEDKLFASRDAGYLSALRQLSSNAGIHLFASASTDQFAFESEVIEGGFFAFSILQALSPLPDDPDGDGMVEYPFPEKAGGTFRFPLSEFPSGNVSVSELRAFIDQFTPALTESITNVRQTPKTHQERDDFPLISGDFRDRK